VTGCTTRWSLSSEKIDPVHVVLEWAIPRAVLDVVAKIKRILQQHS
jgi:hypothetical protein